jgi:hypothetical protein
MTKITNSNQSHRSDRKYKSDNGRTWTSEYIRGGIRCLGRVSIPCRPVTPAVSSISRLGCIGKSDRCNYHKICGKLPANKTVETLSTSTCLSVDCLKLKTDRMSNKLLHIESAARYIHHMQVKHEYHYIGKVSWRWRNWNHPICHKAESLFCC